jgi:hypothetical protein
MTQKFLRSQTTDVEGFIAKQGEEDKPLMKIGGDWKKDMHIIDSKNQVLPANYSPSSQKPN